MLLNTQYRVQMPERPAVVSPIVNLGVEFIVHTHVSKHRVKRGRRVRFSGPESSVDMEVMRGFGGKPVKVLNLPNAAYQDYTQFKSVSHTHTAADHPFSYSGTTGFTSTMDVGSKP